MSTPRLIVIDGIAGSGKSTIGQRLYRTVRLNGRAAQFYHEFCRPHPILGVEADSVSDWVEHSLSQWRRFIDHLSDQDGVAIVDGALFQCGVGDLLERGADAQTGTDYVESIADMVRELRPVMIHLYQADIETALREIWEQRPESWARRVEESFANLPYARGKSLKGFDLYLDFNRSLREQSDRLFEALAMRKLAIDNTDRRWNACFEEICQFLGLPQITDPFDPNDYCGSYAKAGEKEGCRIFVSEGALRVEGLFDITKNLLPKDGDTVFVQTWADELTFARDASGRVVSFRSTGPWNRLGDATWRRI